MTHDDLLKFCKDAWEAGWRYDDLDEMKDTFSLTEKEAFEVCRILQGWEVTGECDGF